MNEKEIAISKERELMELAIKEAEIKRQQSQAIAEQQRKAADKQKAAIQQRRSDIIAGRIKVASMEEAVFKYGAKEGNDIVMRPLLTADNKNYIISGKLEGAEDKAFGGKILTLRKYDSKYLGSGLGFIEMPTSNYVEVEVSSETVVKNQLRMNTDFKIVGKFVNVNKRELVIGSEILVPRFIGYYIE